MLKFFPTRVALGKNIKIVKKTSKPWREIVEEVEGLFDSLSKKNILTIKVTEKINSFAFRKKKDHYKNDGSETQFFWYVY